MPCRSDYMDDGGAEEKAKAKAEIDRLTRLLCAACGALKQRNSLAKVDDELYDWYTEHQKLDARRKKETAERKSRIAQEIRVRVKALAKLTPTERMALGLKDNE